MVRVAALRGQKTKPQPFLHLVDDGKPFGIAGLSHTAQLDSGTVPAVTVITTDAVGESARLHHRMPVIMPTAAEREAWLSPGLDAADVTALCRPLSAGVSITPFTL